MTNTGERRRVTTTVERAWLTYREAQAVSGIGRTKLWELLRDGHIKGAKVGRSVKISRESLDAYLEQQDYVSTVGR